MFAAGWNNHLSYLLILARIKHAAFSKEEPHVPEYLEQLNILETQCSELNWNNHLSYWPLPAREMALESMILLLPRKASSDV
jgi:hypothetical protein